MKFRNIAAVLFLGLCAHAASAQAPAASTPPTPPEPPSAPATPTVPAPPVAAKPGVVEGTLFRSQRARDDRGKFTWVCTYNVAGTRRSVQYDESCPSTLPFELKR